MPIQGFTRLRKHQFARQPSFGNKVAATRAYPFSGTPSVDLAWTDPEIDAGSRDPVAAPYRGPEDLTASLTDPALAYNNIPALMCAFFGGEVVPTGGGTAKTWTHDAASVTVDDPDPFTYEFGDDVLTDWFQLGDGILESVEFHGPDGLGPIDTSMTWRFGSASSTGSTDSPVEGTVPTPDLNVATNDAIVYLKDMAIYIADDVAGLAANQITDALHEFTLRLNQEIDQKRFANGDQSFDIDAYGPGARAIELECVWAKTSQTVGTGSEADDWFSDEAVNRFVQLKFISKVVAQTPSTFYAWTVTMPMRYYTREEGDIGGNTTVVLTGHAFYDPDDFEGVFESVAVTTIDEATVGTITS
jgi:hypothetical protein